MRWIHLFLALLLAAATGACGGTGASLTNGGPGTESAPPAAVPEAGASATAVAGAAVAAAGTPGAGTAATTPEATSEPPDETQIAVAENFVFPRKGPADAKLVIYEFADFRCPYCRQFATDTLPLLEEEFMGDDGLVAIEFVDFPISDHGLPAVVSSEAAHCADEDGLFWEMHDAIFGDFAKMNDLPLEDQAASVDHMVGLAEGIGLDGGPMRECLESERYRPALAKLYSDARAAKIDVTPTLIVGDEIVLGFQPYEEFRLIVERQLSIALGTPAPTVTPGTPTPATATPAASDGRP